ncbi:MAG: 16S rRNA (uracil(1498)-N(3))-methyltransferase [Ignavibacteriae bacterium]|nr:16S rRNA (uracil(1498)-N(3))-methyltransferase [Ignavibacteriota bacterium]
MEYYYTPKSNIDLNNNTLFLEDFEYKHLVKVLRKKEGDLLKITDGLRNIFDCRIVNISKGKVICTIEKNYFNLFEPDVNLKLYIAPLRNNTRLEFALEKAVELGVSCIQPVITEFTVNKSSFSKNKMERISKIIVSAMGQSQRCLLPEFRNTISFGDMLKSTKNDINKIVMYEYALSTEKSKINREIKEINLLIGPEGGFSKQEINMLVSNNWQIHSLGERKMRSETAAIVSVFELLK